MTTERIGGTTPKSKRSIDHVYEIVGQHMLGELDAEKCVLWMLSKTHGYGQLYDGRRTTRAHRLVLRIIHGDQPPHIDARHSCRHRHCFNPHHLMWGTRAENEADKIKDGTTNRGSRQHLSVLTEEQVLYIYHSTEGYTVLGKRFGVDRTTVRDIRKGKSWSWLTGAKFGSLKSG